MQALRKEPLAAELASNMDGPDREEPPVDGIEPDIISASTDATAGQLDVSVDANAKGGDDEGRVSTSDDAKDDVVA